jgi:hypothetical protein
MWHLSTISRTFLNASRLSLLDERGLEPTFELVGSDPPVQNTCRKLVARLDCSGTTCRRVLFQTYKTFMSSEAQNVCGGRRVSTRTLMNRPE